MESRLGWAGIPYSVTFFAQCTFYMNMATAYLQSSPSIWDDVVCGAISLLPLPPLEIVKY